MRFVRGSQAFGPVLLRGRRRLRVGFSSAVAGANVRGKLRPVQDGPALGRSGALGRGDLGIRGRKFGLSGVEWPVLFGVVPYCSAAGVSALGLGAGLAGLTAGYVVQKCRLHCGHSQNCCGGHGSSGPGSFRSIWLPHRWQRTLTSGWSMARQIVVFCPSDSQ